jgi:hypothetical protein
MKRDKAHLSAPKELFLKGVQKATCTLADCMDQIEPYVDQRYRVQTKPPAKCTQHNDFDIELLVITAGNICMHVIDLILDVLIEVNQKGTDHYRMYDYLPKMFNSEWRLILSSHLDMLVEFLQERRLPIPPIVQALRRASNERLNEQVRRLILLIPAQLNAFNWANGNTSVYYFSAFDFSLTVANDILNMLIDSLFDVFIDDWLQVALNDQRPIHKQYKSELKHQVLMLLRYFRLKITAKIHRPLGFLSAQSLKEEMARYKKPHHESTVNPKDFLTVVEYKEEMKKQCQSVVFRFVRKFIYSLVLNKHVRAENVRFKNDLLGMLVTGREVSDFIVTLIFSREDIAHLFQWSKVLLMFGCRTVQQLEQELRPEVRLTVEREQPDVVTKLGRLYERYRLEIAEKNYYEPPDYFERPFPWEKVYCLPPEAHLPGYDPKVPKTWFLNTVGDLCYEAKSNRTNKNTSGTGTEPNDII